MAAANEEERRRWNDEHWTSVWPKRERLTDSVTPFLLEAVEPAPGERALDIGCGGGKATIAVAEAVGSDGTVLGVDVSVPLLELAEARARERGVDNVAFVCADAQTDAIPGRPFDVVLSQFGVMFFDEPVVAFTNLCSHLRPGGRLVFACWQAMEKNLWFPGHAAAPFLPPPEPEARKSPVGAFALADVARTTGILEAAGFVDVVGTSHELEVDAPVESVFDDVQLRLMGVPEERIDEAHAALDAYYASGFEGSGDALRLPLAFQIFAAQRR